MKNMLASMLIAIILLTSMVAYFDDAFASHRSGGVRPADDSITAAKIAADAIGASEIATDAIDADALATDAVTEITGVIVNTGGVATIGAILGDFANTALVTRLNAIDDFIDTEIGSPVTSLAVDHNDIDTVLGAPVGASIVADITVIDTNVDDIEARLGIPSLATVVLDIGAAVASGTSVGADTASIIDHC